MSDIKEETIEAATLPEINHALEKFISLTPEERQEVMRGLELLHSEMIRGTISAPIDWASLFISGYVELSLLKDMRAAKTEEDFEKINANRSRPWMEVW